MKPKQIKILDRDKLAVKWNAELTTIISLKYLRDECPCASCKGETILFKTFRPSKPIMLSANTYKINSIETVGEYAVQISWKDGHNTGIYSWEYLKTLEVSEKENIKQKYDTLL
jgi:DUF971 family protein